MSSTSRYALQSPSVSNEKGAYRMRPPRSSRSGSILRYPSNPSSQAYFHLPYRCTRRLVMLVAFLACATVACFACAYWLFTTRYDYRPARAWVLALTDSRQTVVGSQLTAPDTPDAPLTVSHPSYQDPPALHPLDITLDVLDELDTRLDALRSDHTATYLAYLPHSGLHNQRIALENAITLARLLNRTLLVPPARLGPKTLRYVRSSTLARMLRLSDKRQGRRHCVDIPVGVPQPDECADYMAYTLVPWAWLVNLAPMEARQALVRVSNGTAMWIQERLGVGPSETRYLPDTEPYEYQFVDTPAPGREDGKYRHTVLIDELVAAPERLIQLGTLFGSSRLRLRKGENRQIRGEVRRHMVLSNAALTLAANKIGEALGGTYLGAHVRIGDGRFQKGARANVRVIWWTLVRDVLGVDMEMALELANGVLPKTGGVGAMEGGEGNSNELPDIPPDVSTLRVARPFADIFSPKRNCRRLHTHPSFRRLNTPLFIATDAPDGIDNPLLGPFRDTFPCTFSLTSFEAEMEPLEEIRNGYDGVRLGEYVAPIVDAMVMGRAWAVVGTEGSTFSRYVEDVLWRKWHGWDIVERG